MSAMYDDDGNFKYAVTIPNEDVQKIIGQQFQPTVAPSKIGDFVRILTGPAENYCGLVVKVKNSNVVVEVSFPTGRKFTINADQSSVKLLDIPKNRQAFWGEKV